MNQKELLSIVRGAVISFTGKVGGRGLHMASQVILARLQGPEIFGIFSIAWTTLRIVGQIATLGLDKGVLNYGSKYYEKNQLIKFDSVLSVGVALSFCVSILLAVLLAGFSGFLSNVFFENEYYNYTFIYISLIITIYPLIRVYSSFSTISKTTAYYVLGLDVIQPFTFVLLLAGLYYLNIFTLSTVLFTLLLSFVCSLLISVYGVNIKLPVSWRLRSLIKENKLLTSAIMKYSFVTSLAGTLSLYMMWVDRIIVGLYQGNIEVGIYQAMSQIAVIFSLIQASISSIAIPYIKSYYVRNEFEYNTRILKLSGLACAILGAVILALLFAYNEYLITFLFGSEYLIGKQTILILSIGQYLYLLSGISGVYLMITDKQNLWLKITVIGFMLNLILSIFLVKKFGINGAAFSTLVSLSYTSIALFYNIKEQLSYLLLVISIIIGVLVYIGM